MAYNSKAFQVMHHIPGDTAGVTRAIAAYSTNDAAAAVTGAGYFNDAAGLLPVGSQIFCALDLDGTAASAHYVVSANDGSTVTIA